MLRYGHIEVIRFSEFDDPRLPVDLQQGLGSSSPQSCSRNDEPALQFWNILIRQDPLNGLWDSIFY